VTSHWCTITPQGARLSVQVTPGARKHEVIGVVEDVLKIKLQAQPVDGQANEALVAFFSKTLGIPRRSITIAHGHTSRRKIIEIAAPGVTPEHLDRCLLT
jgi:hypothetical protein